jgi:hypothetical protein
MSSHAKLAKLNAAGTISQGEPSFLSHTLRQVAAENFSDSRDDKQKKRLQHQHSYPPLPQRVTRVALHLPAMTGMSSRSP